MELNLVIYIVSAIIALFLSIPIHELGHLICGKLTGYSFSSYSIFNLTWIKGNGKIVLKRSGSSIALGQCLMAPPENEEDFKYVLYNLGGGLANILTAVVGFAGLFVFAQSKVGFPIMLALFVISLVMGLMNLIPMSSSIPNDGMNIKVASKSKQAKHAFYIMLKVNYELSLGKRYRDFDESMFEVEEPADYSNYLVAFMIINKATRLVDLGRWDDAIGEYDRLDIKKLQEYYRNSIYLDYLYYYTVQKPDFEKAKDIYNKPGVKKFIKIKHPEMQKVLAAYQFFVIGDTDLGLKTLGQAKVAAANLPNEGTRISICDYLRELEEKMTAANKANI